MKVFLFLIFMISFTGSKIARAEISDEETSAYIPIKMETAHFSDDELDETVPPPKVAGQTVAVQTEKQKPQSIDVQKLIQQESNLLNALLTNENVDSE